MNRCEVCDKTDEDDPQAKIALINDEVMCDECRKAIHSNLEDLSVNDDTPIDYLDTFLLPAPVQDDHWLPAALPEVPEQ